VTDRRKLSSIQQLTTAAQHSIALHRTAIAHPHSY
jgi:hypothetical protein